LHHFIFLSRECYGDNGLWLAKKLGTVKWRRYVEVESPRPISLVDEVCKEGKNTVAWVDLGGVTA